MYKLTNTFDILYQQSPYLPIFKKLNQSELTFYTDNDMTEEEFNSYFTLDCQVLPFVVRDVLQGETSYRIKYYAEKWYDEATKFFSDGNYDASFLPLYVHLGLEILGFDKKLAKSFVNFYFIDTKHDQSFYKDMLNSINQFQKKKKYFIEVNENDQKVEANLLYEIFYRKIENKAKFDIREFEKSYIAICNNSFIVRNYKNNSISNILDEAKNEEHTLKAYKTFQQQNAKRMLFILRTQDGLNTSVIDEKFIDQVIKYQVDIAKKVLSILKNA